MEVIKTHINDVGVCEYGCGAIGVVLSSQKTYSKYCTPKVLGTVKECSEKYKESDEIKQAYLGLKREENSKVTDGISRGVCTNDVFPKCENDCGSDRNIYCSKCCVQQKAFRCFTCDKNKNSLYCESCWEKYHKKHKCEVFFCSMRCATK